MSDIDELINLLDEMTDDITRQVREAKEKALIEKLPAMLKENGVNLCITEYRCEGNSVDELRFGFGIDRLDFSEHDKVFEDKIAKLENQIRIYESKIQTLRTRCMESARDNFDKEIYGCLSIVSYPKEIENENKELKQRIAELESKETEKPTKYTTVIVAKEINGQTYVKLDDFMSVVNDLQAEIGT